MEIDKWFFKQEDVIIENNDIESKLLFGDFSKCEDPEISVVMPIYNRPELFACALKSVLEQNGAPRFEVIVVDNNESEGKSPNQLVVENIKATNVFYYRHEKNIGSCDNFNKGVLLARAKYISFCHDDDLFMPNTLRILWNLHMTTKDKCILSRWDTVDNDGNIVESYPYPHYRFKKILVEKNSYNYSLYDQFLRNAGLHTASLFNKEKFLKIGGYKKQYAPSGDYGVNSLYIYYYGGVINAIPSFYYRHGDNDSATVYKQFVEIDKKFRLNIAEKLSLPKWWTNRIIKANYEISKNEFSIEWGKGTPQLNKISVWDKLVMFVARLSNIYKHYKINFNL